MHEIMYDVFSFFETKISPLTHGDYLMKLRCLSFYDDFGFVAFQGEVPLECWFFHSKEQGRTIMLKATDEQQRQDCEGDIATCPLPETSYLEPLCIEGRVAETLTRLILPIFQDVPPGTPVFMWEGGRGNPFLYYLLTPRDEDKGDPSATAIIGVRDSDGNHAVFVFYSKKQGKEILKSRCGGMDEQRVQLAHKLITSCVIPEESEVKQVKIGDPMACFMNNGYWVLRKSGKTL